jgi:hypothetical protein
MTVRLSVTPLAANASTNELIDQAGSAIASSKMVESSFDRVLAFMATWHFFTFTGGAMPLSKLIRLAYRQIICKII